MTDQFLQKQIGIHYSLPEAKSFKRLESYANEVFLYTVSESEKYIVKNYKVHDKNGVKKLHSDQDKIRNHGILIPEIIHNKHGETVTEAGEIIFDVTKYVAHRGLNYDDYNINPEELFETGQILRKIHEIPAHELDLRQSSFNVNVKETLKKISDYQTKRSEGGLKDDDKLELIDRYLQKTEEWRNTYPERFNGLRLHRAKQVVSHGDISLVNLLSSSEGMYLVDWDKLKMRPPMFEVHRTIGLICGIGKVNGNLEPINPDRLKPFLKGYFGATKLTESQISELLEIAEFVSHIDWLDFTLGKILKSDYRILDLLSDEPKENEYWLQRSAFEEYRKILETVFS